MAGCALAMKPGRSTGRLCLGKELRRAGPGRRTGDEVDGARRGAGGLRRFADAV